MGRGRGGNRGGRPANSRGGKQEAKKPTAPSYDEIWDKLTDAIFKGENFDYNFWDGLTTEQKELALMQGGFTGLIGDDFENGMLYYPTEDKKHLLSWMADDIANSNDVYGMDDSVHWTVKYTDGTTKNLSEGDSDYYEDWRGKSSAFTKRRTAQLIQTSKIAWILRTDGYDQPSYWVKDEKALASLKKYGGFERWKKGRGEKRRDYVQDDWI